MNLAHCFDNWLAIYWDGADGDFDRAGCRVWIFMFWCVFYVWGWQVEKGRLHGNYEGVLGSTYTISWLNRWSMISQGILRISFFLVHTFLQ